MGRKTILFAIFIILLAITGVLYFFVTKTGTPTNTNPSPGFFKSIFPFGSNSTESTSSGDSPLVTNTEDGNNNIVRTLPRLRHYTTEPTAGNIISERDRDVIRDRIKIQEKEISLRYIDRATGHIYDIATDVELPKKISNTTIPKVYEATFLPEGNSLVARLLDEDENILTYYITLKDKAPVVATTSVRISTSTQTVAAQMASETLKFKEVAGTYLAKNMREIALSTSGKKILELTYGADSGIFGTIDTALKSKTILTHPLREWLLSYPTDTRAVITTKPSGTVYGYAYLLNTDTGATEKLIGKTLGLTVSPRKDLSAYLIGEASDSINLYILSSKTPLPINLGIKTLPEKCVWANTVATKIYCAVPKNIPNATYPDDWYKGRFFFNDVLWEVNTETGETSMISDLSREGGQAIDAVNLQISPTDKYLTFINKRDLTLWGIDLTKE